jgi:hypothetical protein
MSAAARLPAGFETLEPFVDHWARDTAQGRLEARCTLDMDAIRTFYDAVTERAEDALVYLEQHPLDDMPADARNLLGLVLAMAQAHIAVEIHGQARAPLTPWPNTIRITRGLPVMG